MAIMDSPGYWQLIMILSADPITGNDARLQNTVGWHATGNFI